MNTRQLARGLTLAFLFSLLLTGCRLSQQTNVQSTATITSGPAPTRMNFVMPPTETTIPTETPVTPTAPPTATATTAPTATTEIISNLPARITAKNVRLREGPGTLFGAVGWLKQDESVITLGKARGDDWLYVQTATQKGFIAVAFTDFADSPRINNVPLVDVVGAVVVRGIVTRGPDPDKQPLAGIEFAVYQGDEDSAPPDTRAHSMADGRFYAYLPNGSSGTWRVSLTAIDCESAIVDGNCNYNGAFMPLFTDITLPSDQVLEFEYSE